ncbi:hypothetical protein [Plantactinospora endophytica]|uniref:ATP-binding protein n=1 Tax=Plantactinospora endophytica TaxID=673535 RepID=A0ABQ4DUH2_9ACTN|nr:hypothetical protein [Plantactinospora endophytica]GIG86106.1 hypothetical protein Pen02_10420 [Plantactinospora endophytica]
MTDDRADASIQATPVPEIPASRDRSADPPDDTVTVRDGKERGGPDPATDAGRGLVRMTFNLTPRAADALDSSCAKTKDTKTDTINRALVVYNVVLDLIEQGGGKLTLQHPDGQTATVHLL